MFVNFFLMFGSWRSLIRIQLEFKYLCWRNKEGVSKLTFACYLFLFRHGLHGKHRFSLFFFPWNPRNPCLKEIIKCILTHSLFLFMKKTMCTLSDAYDKKTEEWKREVFRIRGSLRQERIPGKKGFRSRKDFSQERWKVRWCCRKRPVTLLKIKKNERLLHVFPGATPAA